MSAPADRDPKLAATLVNVLMAGLSDSSRLGRGRIYARQGAVVQLDVTPGLISGTVQGSRAEPYRVTVSTTPATATRLTQLVPQQREIRFDCSCPDWDDPCKHAIAVMCEFAERLADDGELLPIWRGVSTGADGPRAVVGSRSAGTDGDILRHRRAGLDEAALAELHTFLGEPENIELPTLIAQLPVASVWDETWSAMLGDALRTLAQSIRLRS